jgi:hypothetical protein
MANDRINFYYDPIRQGLDTTLWKVLSGTPSAGATAITVNAASMIGYADIFKGEITMKLTIPVAPTAGDTRIWGLRQMAANCGLTFEIDGETFSCVADNIDGVSEEVEVTWNTAWTNQEVDWTIKWTGFSAEFLVNGVQIAFINAAGVPKVPLSIYLRNDNADDMDLAYIEAINVQGYV